MSRFTEDGTDRIAVQPQALAQERSEESGDTGGPIEEPTLQGASYLVERITPVPPTRDEARVRSGASALEPLEGLPLPAPPVAGTASPPNRGSSELDEPTAAVKSPAARPQPLRLEAPRPAPELGEVLPISSQTKPLDVSPEVETAYVPLPGSPGATMAPLSERSTVIASAVRAKAAGDLIGRIRGSKNARLVIIAVGGLLSMLLTVLLFSPRTPPPSSPLPALQAEPMPPPVAQPPERPPEPPDPARFEERDQLLERAVLAVEAGRLEEALALFRRYAEEESNPAAEFMVQLLQVQLSQSGKEQ